MTKLNYARDHENKRLYASPPPIKGKHNMKIIDITPTWGEWGNVFYRFAVSGERKAVETLHEDFARVTAMAEALKVVLPALTVGQAEKVNAVMRAEMAKQRVPLSNNARFC
jgi:hypothetical protein